MILSPKRQTHGRKPQDLRLELRVRKHLSQSLAKMEGVACRGSEFSPLPGDEQGLEVLWARQGESREGPSGREVCRAHSEMH